MNQKLKIIFEKNNLIITNYQKIIKISVRQILIDHLKIDGERLQLLEIEEGKIKIYGEIEKMEFVK